MRNTEYMYALRCVTNAEEFVEGKVWGLGHEVVLPSLPSIGRQSRHTKGKGRLIKQFVPALPGLIFVDRTIEVEGLSFFGEDIKGVLGLQKMGSDYMRVPRAQIDLFSAQCQAVCSGVDPDNVVSRTEVLHVGDRVQVSQGEVSVVGTVLKIISGIVTIQNDHNPIFGKINIGLDFVEKIGQDQSK